MADSMTIYDSMGLNCRDRMEYDEIEGQWIVLLPTYPTCLASEYQHGQHGSHTWFSLAFPL